MRFLIAMIVVVCSSVEASAQCRGGLFSRLASGCDAGYSAGCGSNYGGPVYYGFDSCGVQTSQPTDSDSFQVGDLCIYHEGIVSFEVEIVGKQFENDWLNYQLRATKVLNPSWMPLSATPFEVGRKIGVGYCGWSVSKVCA